MTFSPSSPSAIAAVDDLLAGVGLRHGRRRGRKTVAAEGEASRPENKAPTLEVIKVPQWADLPWLAHGFSTRMGGRTTVYRSRAPQGELNLGDLNLGLTASDPAETVAANRTLFVKAVYGDGGGGGKLVGLRQIHSTLVRRMGQEVSVSALPGDGLMTDYPGVLLSIQTADCIPVLVADARRRAVAAFHAGWRGTLGRIVENGVGRMQLEFGSEPGDLVAAIGPGIGPCCYAVGEEVEHEFASQFAYAPELFSEVYDSDPVREKYPLLFLTARAPGHSNLGPSRHLDLWEANRRQLLDAGLKPERIFVAGECTACHTERFFSHRAESGFTGRMMAVIGVRG